MSKELEKLEGAFRKQAETSPRAEAKADAMKLAMQAFEEEKISTGSQGTENEARLNQQGNEKKPLFDWKKKMKTLNSKFGYSLMGGASLAVLAFVMVSGNVSQFTTLDDAPLELSGSSEELGSDVVVQEGELKDDAEIRVRSESEPETIISKVPAARAEVPLEDDAVVDSEQELAALPEPELEKAKEFSGDTKELREIVENKLAPSVPTLVESPAKKQMSNDSSGRVGVLFNPKPREFLNQSSGAVAGLTRRSKRIAKVMPSPAPVDVIQPRYQEENRDKFEDVKSNPVKTVTAEPVSTFSVDVDTASYAFMRSSLNNNQMPRPESIRIEELINYFDYGYEGPESRATPFKANVQIMPTPWNEGTKLMSIGIKGYELGQTETPSANLVFLIDTSGSMNQPNKLPLLRNSFKLLLNSLKSTDTVSIVAYAGSAGTVLEPTEVKDKRKILAALDRLHAGGSTAGAEGIRQAYALAEENLEADGINRVILATDGDFNVGISDPEQLKRYVEKKRKTGVTLSVLGFGRGNYNDHLMQKLAQNGNGNASYIDTLSEARKVLVEEAGSTLFTIAKDVKLQVEFNPGLVSEYRLIGYETRALKREDFNNDKVDAGDIGAGHTVTALYEITPIGAASQNVDPLRYAQAAEVEAKPVVNANPNEYGFMKIRYKLPDSDTSTLITTPITLDNEVDTPGAASRDVQFASAVAGFGQLLIGGEYTGDYYSYDDIIELARSAKGGDEFGYRAEFINLVRLAKSVEGVQ